MTPRHPFSTAVRDALKARGLSKGDLCATLGHAPGWYSAIMRRVANGTASLADIRAIADVVAPSPEAAKALTLLAFE